MELQSAICLGVLAHMIVNLETTQAPFTGIPSIDKYWTLTSAHLQGRWDTVSCFSSQSCTIVKARHESRRLFILSRLQMSPSVESVCWDKSDKCFPIPLVFVNHDSAETSLLWSVKGVKVCHSQGTAAHLIGFYGAGEWCMMRMVHWFW